MGALAQVLRNQERSTDPNLLVGSEHFDDAGVYRLSDTTALVQTVDFFPPLVDDPIQFGRIAAANSLSDVYAMGGRPLTVLNIVGFPDKDLPLEILAQILDGGGERVAAAGAVVVGGHTVRDAEVKFGLSVTGIVHPDRILANGGARIGDVLILTKPIGSGVLTTAAKKGTILESDLSEAIDVMTDLNAGACEAAIEIGIGPSGVHSATDITGFGLIGHAYEMAEASKVTLEIRSRAVPLLNWTLQLAEQGMVTRAAGSNLAHIGDGVSVVGVEDVLVKVLADAQTSGGLLLSVTANRADALVQALRVRRTRAAAVIGCAVARGAHAIVLV